MSRKMANAFAGSDSSSDEENSDDDFLHPSTDPNAEEFADYNPRKRRRTGRDAKESAALGIFGSESEDDGPRWKSKERKVRSRGVAFVSAGNQARGEDEDEDEDEDDMEEVQARTGLGMRSRQSEFLEAETNNAVDEEEDEDEDEKPRFGLGLGVGSNAGLGSRSQGGTAMRNFGGGLGAGGLASSPFGKGFVPSSDAVPILRDDLKDDRPSTPRAALPSAFSTPSTAKSGKGGNASKPGTSINAGSFAARMMAKMGYKEGQGLGKDGQGRSGVIEVQLRPQGVGVGAVREKSLQERAEEKRQAALRGEVLEDSDEEKKKRKKSSKLQTVSRTDSGMSTPRRKPKAKYQSLQEVQRAAPGLEIPDAFTPILDMTGPGQRMLTSSSGILTPTAKSETAESGELVEARKLARRAQNDLSAFVEEWKNLKERQAWVEMEILQQHQLVDDYQEQRDQMGSVATIVQDISDSVKSSQWDPVIKALTDVEALGVADTEELSNIAVASVFPFFRQAVEGWQPLDDPKLSGVDGGFAAVLLSIRHLLGLTTDKANGNQLALREHDKQNGIHGRAHKTTAFESLIYTVWFPKIRAAITNAWDVYDPTPVQTLLEIWSDLLPPFVRSQILDHLIVRKLDEAIGDWNPKRSRRHASPLPHLWLFPWLQYLPSHHADPKSSTGLVSDVKRKFRQLIDSWDFKRGVIPGLEKWRMVLQPKGASDQWTPLMLNHVLPNLTKYLRTNFKVAPQDQAPFMPYLENTLLWTSILGTRVMSQVIVDEVFPMWLDVLHTWLTLDGVNYNEVIGWVQFWRSIFPSEIDSSKPVQAEWQRGQALIETALTLGSAAKSQLPLPETTRPQSQTVPISVEETKPKPPREEPRSLQSVVEAFCWDENLQFIAQRNTLDANGPVYRVTAAANGKGGVLVYFKGEKVFAQYKGNWTDLGAGEEALGALLVMAEGA